MQKNELQEVFRERSKSHTDIGKEYSFIIKNAIEI